VSIWARGSDEEAEREAGDGLIEAPVGGSLDVLVHERDELLRQVRQLEEELDRYRAQARLLGKTLFSAMSYAEWVREGARHDAELALRKARARAERTVGDAERDRARAEREFLHVSRLTDETRARLTALLTTALDQLRIQTDGDRGNSEPVPVQPVEVESSEP